MKTYYVAVTQYVYVKEESEAAATVAAIRDAKEQDCWNAEVLEIHKEDGTIAFKDSD